jgi:tubulin monoglycylase TTLL3/8
MIGEGIYLKEMVNMFEFHKDITSKIGLVRSFQKYYNYQMTVPFNIIPMVFVVNFEERNWDLDIQAFVDYYLANLPEKFKKEN